jgi:hypothetical protein
MLRFRARCDAATILSLNRRPFTRPTGMQAGNAERPFPFADLTRSLQNIGSDCDDL